MEAYTSFAKVYDIFMDNVPYDQWAVQTMKILKEHGIDRGIVAELGCGTGSLTERIAREGYDMIGIDSSADMLELAYEKKMKSGSDILYLCQDMRSFELYGTCRAFVSRCDTINYLTSFEDLVQTFRLVNNYLDPEGIFVFDCNTIYKFENIIADNTIAESREIGSFIWENYYDRETCINEADITIYVKDAFSEGRSVDRFLRFEETHYQRAFNMLELKAAADMAGLVWVEAVDADTMESVTDYTQRYLVTLMEQGKLKN